MIVAKHAWVADLEAFLGVVYDETHDEQLVLTVGKMKTEKGIKHWLKDTVKREAWKDDSELPDMHDSVQ